jgi:putative ABC transport system permease protein
MLRGRIVKLNGESVEMKQVPAEAEWVLSGDRGLTYSATVPDGSHVVAGSWWREDDDKAGPLVSFEVDLARRLGLGLGDTVTVNVLGRDITAKIANLREVNWESLTINFVMVFSPGALQGAPHNLLATITFPPAVSLADEAAVARTIAKVYPTMTVIRVKDALSAFAKIFGKVMTAVRVAGGVTLLAGALVLAGGLATAEQRRTQQAVILKTLGATRARIVAAHLAEYAILALVCAAVATLIGGVIAWFALARVMHVALVPALGDVAQALLVALALVGGFGAVATWRVLSARAVPYLRSQ